MNREERRRRARERRGHGTYQGRLVTSAGGAQRFAFGEAARPENRDKDEVYQAWVMAHYPMLATMAWEIYEEVGRCALVQHFGDDDRPSGPTEPTTPAALERSVTRRSAALLQVNMAEYDPEQDIVIAIVESKTRRPLETAWVYKMRHPECRPPRAAALLDAINAEARRERAPRQRRWLERNEAPVRELAQLEYRAQGRGAICVRLELPADEGVRYLSDVVARAADGPVIGAGWPDPDTERLVATYDPDCACIVLFLDEDYKLCAWWVPFDGVPEQR